MLARALCAHANTAPSAFISPARWARTLCRSRASLHRAAGRYSLRLAMPARALRALPVTARYGTYLPAALLGRSFLVTPCTLPRAGRYLLRLGMSNRRSHAFLHRAAGRQHFVSLCRYKCCALFSSQLAPLLSPCTMDQRFSLRPICHASLRRYLPCGSGSGAVFLNHGEHKYDRSFP